jgi:hypothetical protein
MQRPLHNDGEGASARQAVAGASPSDEGPSLHALSDAPLDDDRADALAFGAYADALAGLIDNPETGTPLTLAINAPWGAGKSTLGQMLRRRLEAKPAPGDSRPHIVCSFNAWMHDDAPSLAAAFAAEITRVANRERHWLRRILNPLPQAFWSTWERSVLWASIVVGLTLISVFATAQWQGLGQLVLLLTGEAKGGLTSVLGAGSGVSGGLLLLVVSRVGRPLFSAAKSVASFVDDPKAAANLGNLKEVRAQLGDILNEARRGPRRLVVFVDDLERCLPPRAIDLLEVVNQLLDHVGVVVVIMADMPAVAASAEIKYKELADQHIAGANEGTPARGTYGRLYLHKIVQLEFDLPPYPTARMYALLARLTSPTAVERGTKETSPIRRLASRSHVPLVLRRALLGEPWALAEGAFATAAMLLSVDPAARLIARLSFARGLQLFLIWSSLFALLLLSERMRRKRLAQARELIDRGLLDDDSDAEIDRLLAESSPSLTTDERNAIRKERELLRIMNDERMLREAHAEVYEHVSPYPRSAKRFLNHVRVLAAVGRARGALGGTPELSVRHIARWVALKERWPLTAAAMLRRPERIALLEQRAREGHSLHPLLEACCAETWDAAALSELLRSGSVRLADVDQRLMHFLPAEEVLRKPPLQAESDAPRAVGDGGAPTRTGATPAS